MTVAQGEKLKPQRTAKGRPDGRGRPWSSARAVLNGIILVLRTGAPCCDHLDLAFDQKIHL